ncbi:O-antigen ligase family protein [Micromonospora lupini]|uniref:O-antigen ligase family protein n=1 Tax=Micromonospora lupini TaxID=285679 RepID=UPI00224E75E9|nr:O-antigen ligase family protein [Micromonospora lupini]MCX5070019.1 O-antigen ligase family protein [Micromonospora lupini]
MTAAPPGTGPTTTPRYRATATERLVPAAGRRRRAVDAHPAPPPSPPAGSLPAVLTLCVVAFLAARPPWWSFNYGAILAVIAIVLTGRLPRLHRLDVVALLTGGWAAASLLWSSRTDLTGPAAYRYISVCVLFVACRHVVRGRRDLLLVGWTYLGGCAVVAVEVATGARSQGQVLLFAERYGVDGKEVNVTAYTLAVGVALALVLAAAGAHRRLLRLTPLALIVLLGYAVLLTGSRGAAIGVLLGLVAALATRIAPRLTAVTVAGFAAALIALVPFGLAPKAELLWLDGLYGRPTGDISGRLSIWPYALSTWSESPLAGSGAGVFIGTNPFEIGPHNLLLTVGNDLGLVGVALYFATMAGALVVTARTGRAGLLTACAFVGAMLPIWLTGQWETSLAFWLALALVTVLPGIWGPRRPPGIAARHARARRRLPTTVAPTITVAGRTVATGR